MAQAHKLGTASLPLQSGLMPYITKITHQQNRLKLLQVLALTLLYNLIPFLYIPLIYEIVNILHKKIILTITIKIIFTYFYFYLVYFFISFAKFSLLKVSITILCFLVLV